MIRNKCNHYALLTEPGSAYTKPCRVSIALFVFARINSERERENPLVMRRMAPCIIYGSGRSVGLHGAPNPRGRSGAVASAVRGRFAQAHPTGPLKIKTQW